MVGELKELIQKLGLSGTHAKILSELWKQDWVTSDRLLEITGQQEFARRVRELRSEWGFSIESSVIKDAGWSYRLLSKKPMFEKRRRKYLNDREKERVIERDGPECSICGFRLLT